jgi:phage terminase small subunit
MKTELAPRQRVFVQEYLIDQNGAQAAIRAGYASIRARETAYELLRIPRIAKAVATAQAQRAARTQMAADLVIDELAHIAMSRINHYTVDEDTGDLMLREGAPLGAIAAVQSVKSRKRVHVEPEGSVVTTFELDLTLWDKPSALKLLGRHLGLFAERVEHSCPDGPHVEVLARIERVIVQPVKQLTNGGEST